MIIIMKKSAILAQLDIKEMENTSHCWSQDLHLELKIVADKHTTFLFDG